MFIFLPGDSHLTESAAEPEPLRQTETDQVAELVSVQTLLELLTLEDFYVIVESGNGLEDKVGILVKVIDDNPVSDREQRLNGQSGLGLYEVRLSILVRDLNEEEWEEA